MPPPPAALTHIALLGPGGESFAIRVQEALHTLLPQQRSALAWLPCLQAEQAAQAQMRWLLPWQGDEDPDNAAMGDLLAHQALRQSLHALGLSYQALRGSRTQCVAQALQSLLPWLPELGPMLPQTGVKSRRPGWSCSECSDPGCEHRSFTELLARREAG